MPSEDMDREITGDELTGDELTGDELISGAQAAHVADRAPTEEEERMAEEVATDVDPASQEAYRHMAELGASVEGEGKAGL